MTQSEQTIDCRGMQCPEPILLLAKTARQMSGAGTLLVQADDDAFPLDVKSWCKSSGAELLRMDRTESGFAAHIRLAGRLGARPGVPARRPSPPHRPEHHAETTLDCRGKQCPEPILDLARAARTSPGAIRVLSDDPAFELDVKSWARTTRATIESLTTEGGVTTALIVPASISARAPNGQPNTVISKHLPGPESSPTSAPPTPRVDFDFRGLADEADLAARLDAIATAAAGMDARVVVATMDLAQVALRWVAAGGHALTAMHGAGPVEMLLHVSSAPRSAPAQSSSAMVQAGETEAEADCALLVLHNDLGALLAAMLIANGAAAQGLRVVVFFTFWGLNLLRADAPNLAAPAERVSFIQRIFKWMMPRGPRRQQLGQLNFGGAGPVLLKGLMRKQNLTDLPRLVSQAQDQGVRFVACTMSMSVMGITKRDLTPYPNLDFGGVSYFVGAARGAKMSLVF